MSSFCCIFDPNSIRILRKFHWNFTRIPEFCEKLAEFFEKLAESFETIFSKHLLKIPSNIKVSQIIKISQNFLEFVFQNKKFQ